MWDETKNGRPGQIPEHELIRRIGRGSYGEVWLARAMTGTFRAVKIVHRKDFDDHRPFDRELAGIHRFEPISRSHEGFIDVLQVGQNRAEGYFYYVMELGDDQQSGQQIDPETYRPKNLSKELAARGSLPIEECLQIGLSLSNSLAHLHAHGLIHRDIKPSNIIFVNGVPKLADIGLVADINEAVSYVGTEGYIPPEGPGSPQADLYSLGKVLYEMSTGKDRHDFPQLPIQLGDVPDTSRFLELNEVIVKACQGDLRKRYPTAQDMHADLVVLQNGKSVKRLRLLERRWATFTKVAVIGTVLLVLASAALYEVDHERTLAAEARQRQAGAQLANGRHAMEGGDLLGALPFFVEALRLDHGQREREITHRVRLHTVLAQCPKLVQMWFLEKRVNWAEFSPDGQRLVTAIWGGKVQVWNASTGAAVSPPFGQGTETASFSPDGSLIVTASTDRTASVWEAASGRRIFPLPHARNVNSACFSPDGRRILTTCNDKRARVWDARTGTLLLELDPHLDLVVHASFSPDGRFIATASRDDTAQIWDAQSGKRWGEPLKHKTWVYHASFSPDGQRLVTASFDRKAHVWDVVTGRESLPALNHADGVRSAEFSPDGCFILTASFDGTARIWDANSQLPVDLNPIFKHGSRVIHASFHPDGHRFVTACLDGTTRIWDLAASALLPRAMGTHCSQDGTHWFTTTNNIVSVRLTASTNLAFPPILTPHPVEEAMLSGNGKFALTIMIPEAAQGQAGRTWQGWDVTSGKPLGPGLLLSNGLNNVTLSDDGRRLVVVAGTVAQTFDVATGNSLSPRIQHDRAIVMAVFSPAGDRLLTVAGSKSSHGDECGVHVWDAKTGEAIFPALLHAASVSDARFSPDGRMLVTSVLDDYLTEHDARVWNAATGEAIRHSLKHHDGVLHASFSRDARRVVTASEDFTSAVWDPVKGRQLTPPLVHEDKVEEACFSENSRWILTASKDKSARVWDAETGDPLTPALRHPVALRHAAFLAGDSLLFTTDKDGAGWIWELSGDPRPLNDWLLLAQLLSSSPLRPADEASTARPKGELRTIWNHLRLAYADDFTVSREELLAWHRWQAGRCEENQKWLAAIFHFDHLLALQPEDAALAKRRAKAQQELLKERAEEKGTLD